jgi:hypothetical protein
MALDLASAVATHLAASSAAMRAGSPLLASTYCFKYASLPRGSACKTPPSHRLDGVHRDAGHWALTDSRPCATLRRLIRRLAHLIILRAVDLAWRLGGFVTNRQE